MEITRLSRLRTGDATQWLSAEFLPAYGMNVLRIRAWVPALGEVDILAPVTPEVLAANFDPIADPNAWRSFKCGGAWILPFANRIWPTEGVPQQAGEIIVLDQGQQFRLTEFEGYSGYSLHGLMLRLAFGDIHTSQKDAAATLTASADLGNFDRRWPSNCALQFSAHLASDTLTFAMRATNTGNETMPMAVGWHPYFNIFSGQREEARLHLPASQMLELESYESLRPTYRALDIAGTDLDFSPPEGRPLGKRFYDDCFVSLDSPNPEAALYDPASGTKLTLRAESPEIRAIQIFSRTTDKFIAIEPQYNITDPFDPRWQVETGVTRLEPGASTTYRVSLRLEQTAPAA